MGYKGGIKMSNNVQWEEVMKFPVNEKTKVLEKSLRQVKLNEDKSHFLVLSGKVVPLSAEEKSKREKVHQAKKEAEKQEKKAQREKKVKQFSDKFRKYKAEKELLHSKMKKFRKEVKELSAKREFGKAGDKQDQLNELQKEFNQLRNLNRAEVLQRY